MPVRLSGSGASLKSVVRTDLDHPRNRRCNESLDPLPKPGDGMEGLSD